MSVSASSSACVFGAKYVESLTRGASFWDEDGLVADEWQRVLGECELLCT